MELGTRDLQHYLYMGHNMLRFAEFLKESRIDKETRASVARINAAASAVKPKKETVKKNG